MSQNCKYLPDPTRAWSRVQSNCTYVDPGNTYNNGFLPLTGQTGHYSETTYEEKLFYKGNILQYKANSATLNKNQRYSRLAKGLGPNRRKVYATQTQTYTNPNTSSLLRVNYTEVPFPNQFVVPSPFDCSTNNFLQDGGNLVCGTYANPCSGEIVKNNSSPAVICNPSYCSDVPGRPIDLCWSNKIQTFYPRQRYIMTNSANKWPQGYKGFVSAIK